MCAHNIYFLNFWNLRFYTAISLGLLELTYGKSMEGFVEAMGEANVNNFDTAKIRV